MERPLQFSIIIPTYNYAAYLPDAINSVLAQDQPDTEILVIDDASTDATTEIAHGFGDRIKYHRLARNLGAAGAWDFGLRQARGEYLCKLDADDQQMPGFLAAAAEALALDPSIGLVASSVMLKMNGHRLLVQKSITDRDITLGADEFRERFLHEFFLRMPGVCIRKRITMGADGPDHALYQVHDWEYLLRVTRGHKARLLARPLAVYQIHDSSITRTAQGGRLFENDCARWLDQSMQRGPSYLEERERNILAGSLAILMMRSMKYPYTPGALARYFAARKIAAVGGNHAVGRLNLYLARKVREILWRNLKKIMTFPLRAARWLLWRIRRAGELFRKGGYGAGLRFIREEARNTWTFLTRNQHIDVASVRVECNICGWKGKRFNTHCGAGYVVYGCICPSCGSFPRHRGFAYVVDTYLKADLGRINRQDGARLLFAPERAVYQHLARYMNDLIGVDTTEINDMVRVRGDIQNIPFPDDSVCFLSCFHVIEHVPDDRAALDELNRILVPDGGAVICVPIKFNAMKTIEFGRPNPLLEDHYFDYGLDFGDRLIAAKFRGTAYRLSKIMPRDLFVRLSLQDELIFILQKADKGRQPSICDHQGYILYGQ